jgi:GT2 family glycosyltransferase
MSKDYFKDENIQVSLIVLNYNTKKMTVDCVNSFIKNFDKEINYEIILVDNNSCDGSKEYFKRMFLSNKNVKLVFSNENLGFGKGNNLGAEHSVGKHLIFANSDTIPNMFSIRNMVNCFDQNAKIGALGCMIQNADGSIQSLGFNYPSLINDFKLNFMFWNFRFVKKIRYSKYRIRGIFRRDWVSGCFLMCLKTSFEAVGGFDSQIFMYAEDLDLCARFEKFGLVNYVIDTECIFHLHGKSGKLKFSKLIEAKKNYYYVIKKNKIAKYAKVIFCMNIINIILIYSLKTIIRAIKK